MIEDCPLVPHLGAYQAPGRCVARRVHQLRAQNVRSGGRPCVKTHKSTKCRKYNSPTRYRTVWAQHDSTLTTRNYSEIFYARGGARSFHTASVIRVMGDETDPLFPLL